MAQHLLFSFPVFLLAACEPASEAPASPPADAAAAPPAEPAAPQSRQIWGLRLQEVERREALVWLQLHEEEFELRLRLQEGLSAETAQRIAEERLRRFASTFEPSRTGYPGQITTTVECPEAYRPVPVEQAVPGGNLRAFRGWANANGVPGACSADLVRWANLHGYLVCEKGLLAEIDINDDPQAPKRLDELLARLDCEGL